MSDWNLPIDLNSIPLAISNPAAVSKFQIFKSNDK